MYENKNNEICHVGQYEIYNRNSGHPGTMCHRDYGSISVSVVETKCDAMEIDDAPLASTNGTSCGFFDAPCSTNVHYLSILKEYPECEPYMLDLLEKNRLSGPSSSNLNSCSSIQQQQQQQPYTANSSSIQGLSSSLHHLHL